MSSGSFHDVLIIGAGHGGAQVGIALRHRGFAGSIALVGNEHELPYERPPLSKDYLAGGKPFEQLLLRPAKFWREREIDLFPGCEIVSVHPDRHEVVADDGRVLRYRTLIWATGGVPRRLVCSGHNLLGVHAVRNRADVDRLRSELSTSRRVVVIGGGYIGLESAAVLMTLGQHVTVLEAQDRVLARVAGPPLSEFYQREHRAHGVDIRLDAVVSCINERDGRVCSVELESGERLFADVVIVGVGIIPAVEPLLAAGAEGGNGVDVDGRCRTTLPDIFAIGDCASHVSRFAEGRRIRLESVQNANDQAAAVAATLTGSDGVYNALPWFWSSQYDLRLQTVGLSTGYDEIVMRGDPATRAFTLIYLRAGVVIALDCVNRVRDYVQGRELILSHRFQDRGALARADVPLKDIACAAGSRLDDTTPFLP